MQTGSQRTNGFELGINGSITRAWKIAGGYAYQDAFVTSATTAARAGAQVGQVPHHTFSLWNNYQICRGLGAGLGILNRSDMFAAIDNTVRCPATRAPTRPCSIAHRADRACRRTSRTCSTGSTTSTRTATPTSRRVRPARCASD